MVEKKYIIDDKTLMADWDSEKNLAFGIEAHLLTQGSSKKAWWICERGHSYESKIKNRARGYGCPYCAGKMVLKGYNDLETLFPQVALEWDYQRNGELTPANITFGSNKRVWWKCEKCGGEYESCINNRTRKGTGCPYCAGQKVLVGYNDLQTKFPELVNEWSEKNSIKPTEVTAYSNEKVYWTCAFGHDDYLMSVKQRSNRHGCPVCAQQSQTSFPEQAIYFYLKQVFNDTVNRYIFNGSEIDIFIPSKKIGIEYNGYFYHQKKVEKDIYKKDFLSSFGITVLIVKEYRNIEEKNQADFYIHERTTFNDLTDLINDILNSMDVGNLVDVNCSRDAIAIKNQYVRLRKENSVSALRPELVKYWDYEKNGSVTPEMVSLGTGQQFYWKCRICNRSYLNWPSRIAEGSVCSKHRNLLKTEGNDLATKHPEILKYWDYEKNKVKPSEIYGGGERVVYWKCEKGHSYTKSILKHIKGSGCPVCAGKEVLAGFNDLLSKKPELAKEWDYELNDCTPSEIYYNNQSKKIHWICSVCGYKWQYKINNRNNCPECNRRKKQINVYDVGDLSFLGSFKDIKDLCEHFGIDYKKQHGNVSSVCNRKQKTLMGKYILRHANDDEFNTNSILRGEQ